MWTIQKEYMLVRFRAHHIARLIEYQNNMEGLARNMAMFRDDKKTINATRNLFFSLYERPKSVVEVLPDCDVIHDDICCCCSVASDNCCIRDYGMSTWGGKLDANAREKYSLTEKTYLVEELLEKKLE